MKFRVLLLLALAVLLAACGQPLPSDRMNYAGEWRSEEMYLLITREGRVNYVRRKGGSGSTKVQGPLRAFEGNDFIVGLPLVNTRFVVAKPPTEADGKWTMTVDGVVLVRTSR